MLTEIGYAIRDVLSYDAWMTNEEIMAKVGCDKKTAIYNLMCLKQRHEVRYSSVVIDGKNVAVWMRATDEWRYRELWKELGKMVRKDRKNKERARKDSTEELNKT